MIVRRTPLANSVLSVNSVVETRFIVQDGILLRPYRARLLLHQTPWALPRADILRPAGALECVWLDTALVDGCGSTHAVRSFHRPKAPSSSSGADDIPGVDSFADQARARLLNPVGIPRSPWFYR